MSFKFQFVILRQIKHFFLSKKGTDTVGASYMVRKVCYKNAGNSLWGKSKYLAGFSENVL